MKIRSKFILAVTLVLVPAAVVGLLSVNRMVTGMVGNQEKTAEKFADQAISVRAGEQMTGIYQNIQRFGRQALEQAALFSAAPPVQKAYQIALAGHIDDPQSPQSQQARELLRKELAPYIQGFKTVTGESSFQLHFHLPNGRSLVRLWRDGWQTVSDGRKVDISDDISSFRKMVMQINQGDHKPLTGIEVGRGGFAIRGVAPVTGPGGEHLGSCELLYPFSALLEAVHNSDYESAVYMNADLLPIATKLQDPKKYPVLAGKYVLTAATNRKLTDSLVTDQLLASGENGGIKKNLGNQFVIAFPLRDYAGKVAGVMLLAYDTTDSTMMKTEMAAQAGAVLKTLQLRFGIGALVSLLLVGGILFLVARRVTAPLARTVEVTESIALGDLSQSVELHGRDEVGQLSRSLERMVESLREKAQVAETIATGDLTVEVRLSSERDRMGQALRTMTQSLQGMVGDIHSSAEQIASGAAQIADSDQSLSQGATEQASSLEEISSSMTEMGSQTALNAENSTQAATLAAQARQAADRGNEQMREMTRAMGEINVAGENISRIIKVIDEIAFQTNLLALNAAVEAARAGQHGKGFAVVAEEVRNLAARSAKAAKETAELIEGSVRMTENGSQIADRTAQALQQIVGDVTKVTDLVAEIAAASNEQAQGIAQVSQGVAQIDQVTQQNTANAEESAAAAEELSSQAAQLRGMLGRFKLNESRRMMPAAQSPREVKPKSPVVRTPALAWPAEKTAAPSVGNRSPDPATVIALDDEDFGKY